MPSRRADVVILGSGWAAFSLLKKLDARFSVAVVSPSTHFTFTPLLASTTVGTLDFRSVVEPIRTARRGVDFHLAECRSIDAEGKRVTCVSAQGKDDSAMFQLEYERLVIATGLSSATFGTAGVGEHAHFLRTIGDAQRIRQRIIECFERAAVPGLGEEKRRRLLHFVVVGGGPTGIEFAGELQDFVRSDVPKAYPSIDARDIRITLVEPREILSAFDKKLRAHAASSLAKHSVTIRKGIVQSVHRKHLVLKEMGSDVPVELPFGLCVWSTGLEPSDFLKSLDQFEKVPSSGRLAIDQDLRLVGHENVYAIGDCASVMDGALPCTAQVAAQEGKFLASVLNKGDGHRPKFNYHHRGMLAYIGRFESLVDMGNVRFAGFMGWIFWRSAYATTLVSWRNKILVPMDWFKQFVFGRDVSRF